ncbi:MAG: glycosyl hydrolase family 39 [Candidatus Acidiferrales bacterium]
MRIAFSLLLFLAAPYAFCSPQQQNSVTVQVDWIKPIAISKSTPTLQVVVNPLLRASSPIHDAVFASLKNLNADFVRYVPWLPYPKLAVAELTAPTSDHTSWDFSLIDPMTLDFLQATAGHPVVLNFSTAPAWLFKTDKPVEFPADPDQVAWNYTQGTELQDPTGGELGEYYARLVDWYTNGGFTDENGTFHSSGHHFQIPYWEVFNEPDIEHSTTAEQYTARYDAVVEAIRAQNPHMKFVGLALAYPEYHPEMFEYFLNHANHHPGIPLDMISYHFYAKPTKGQPIEAWQYTLFDQADRFVSNVRYIEEIRKRLSPETQTTIDEIGTILPTDWHPATPYAVDPPIPAAYWNLSGCLYTYVYIESAKLGIDVIGESQLVGFPSQFPSVTMLDWSTGKPNARFAVLQLIHDHFSAGDTLVSTRFPGNTEIDAQAFTRDGIRKMLIVNKRDRSIQVDLPAELAGSEVISISASTGAATSTARLAGNGFSLGPLAVAVIETRK